jgi:tetratricopeptide (TPR) repeat protein
MIHLGEQVMRRLRTKHDPARAEAEWLRLRDDLLAMLQKEVVPLAQRIEGQGVSAFAFATFHQRLGDLLRRLGQFEDARREFQQGYDRIARIAHDQPENDMARANLGVMLLRLGEMALEQRGDAAQAHDEFDRAWKIQEEISLHPRSGNYSKADNLRLLSGIAIKQATAELGLGHPQQARDRFLKALELRQAWTEAEPRNASAKSYVSEAETWLGVALSHLGDWQGARPHFEQALKICASLAEQFPAHLGFKGDLALVYSDQGQAMARSGLFDEAAQAFRKSLNYSGAVLARDPEDATQRLVTAGVNEWLAALAQKCGDPAQAEKHWHSALQIRTELAELETQNVPAQLALALALAHTGHRDQALKRALELLHTNRDRPAVLLPVVRCFAACAACAATDADRRNDQALAQDALSAAVRNGYRDPVAIRADPEFAPLLADPGFKKLVDGISP